MSTGSGLPPDRQQAIEAQLHAVRDRMTSFEGLGRSLIAHVLTRAATYGTLKGDRLEVPVTVSVKLPQTARISATPVTESSSDEPIHGVSMEVTCTLVCFDVTPTEVTCDEECTTTLILKD